MRRGTHTVTLCLAAAAFCLADCSRHAGSDDSSGNSNRANSAPGGLSLVGSGGSGSSGAPGTGQSAGSADDPNSVFRRIQEPQSGATGQSGSAAAIAGKLSLRNVDSANDFSPAHGIDCSPGGSQDRFSFRCHAIMFDSERSAQTAALDFLIYDSPPDFESEDAKMAVAVRSLPGRGQIENKYHPSMTLPGSPTMSLTVSCHQSVGDSNGPALCLVQADPRVLVASNVAPAHPSTQATNNMDSLSSDNDRAKDLAVLGAVHVAESR